MKIGLHFFSKKWRKASAWAGIFLFLFLKSDAQCPGGFTRATVNWDNLDYLITTGNYSPWVTAAMSETQRFSLGTNFVTINRTSGITTTGEDAVHTGESNSFGTGQDVSFTGDGTITLTFNTEVRNLEFSLYDIDRLQSVTVTATDASSNPQTITMTVASGTVLTVTGSPGTSPNGYDPSPATSVANSSSDGTLNISIAGPVKTVTISISTSNSTKDFWLSDISACVSGNFSGDYLSIMQPFTGQPTYIMATPDNNSVCMVNVSTGVARMIFQDPAVVYINSLAYDPVRHEVYYVSDFTGSPSSNKALKKYTFSTNAISTVISDVTTFGIALFDRGVESAGGAFYDGSYYMGIEGVISGNSGSRETIIWRINFDGSGNPVNACQVFAQLSDNGSGSNSHDWNDFVVVDSILVDFNGATSSSAKYSHYNLNSGTVTNTYTTGDIWNKPRQTGITWNEQIYWVYDSLAVYNGNGTIGARTRITGPTAADWTGYAGDATGFRPPSDFGDAPASYDPDPLSPALHLKDTSLRLGPLFDDEFSKLTSANADGDGADEDGISTVNVLDTATTNYIAEVTVYNNSGANATLIGWLDIDGNGLFDASEAVSMNIPHGGPVLQTVTLSWMGINTPLTNGQTTFLRIRLTPASFGMGTGNATGYYGSGEVEDYPVYVTHVLPLNLLQFSAGLTPENKVVAVWRTENENNVMGYRIQRSKNGVEWEYVQFVPAKNLPGLQEYSVTDHLPFSGKSFYRLEIAEFNKEAVFSKVVIIHNLKMIRRAVIFPNPVSGYAFIRIFLEQSADLSFKILNVSGAEVRSYTRKAQSGETDIPIPVSDMYPGVYLLRIEAGREFKILQFIKK